MLQRAFGHDSCFLYAEQNGAIRGLLPLGHIRSRLFGNALISSPFCVLGGAIGDPQACAALEQAAIARAQTLGVDYLELRHAQARHGDWPAKRSCTSIFARRLIPIPK